MNAQQMLDAIYEKYADKTLSFWCLILSDRFEWICPFVYISDHRIYEDLCYIMISHDNYATPLCAKDNIVEIIWHPISLTRVLSVLGDTYFFDKHIFQKIERDDDWLINSSYMFNRKLLNDDWRDLILDDQSDETIQAIYNILFPTT